VGTVTAPVWDGDGKDPWLPSRLAALLNAETAERHVFEIVWDALAQWVTATGRRVLRGPIIDPENVFSQAPAWERAVARIINTALAPIMSRIYVALFGEDYPWRGRPAIVTYFTEVNNLLSRVPGEVFDLIAGQLAAGVVLGESISELRDRIEKVFSTTATPRWENRAVIIARTETLGALNASRLDAFTALQDDGGVPLQKIWLATKGPRTRPAHAAADGQRVPMNEFFIVGGQPLMFPGDKTGSASNTINCRCTILAIDPDEEVPLTSRQLAARSV
jgi:hypothetical protein